jgi:hypothetical protein
LPPRSGDPALRRHRVARWTPSLRRSTSPPHAGCGRQGAAPASAAEPIGATLGSPEAERLAPLVGAGFVRARPPSAPLAPPVAKRFDRQLPYLAQLGDPTELQERLGAAQVAVLGCGGLGTWALAAIASTGVGRFVIVDDDTVELANLNRQVIYNEADLGTAKVTAAARWLRAFDPAIAVSAHERAVEGVADAAELVAGSDLVILAADWPPYALGRWVNEACVGLGVPFITAGQQRPRSRSAPRSWRERGRALPAMSSRSRTGSRSTPSWPLTGRRIRPGPRRSGRRRASPARCSASRPCTCCWAPSRRRSAARC